MHFNDGLIKPNDDRTARGAGVSPASPPANHGRGAGLAAVCRRISVALGLFVAVSFLNGCRSTTPAQALAPQLAGNEPAAQLEFWHVLPQRKAVSNDEAFHALLLFVDGNGVAGGYDQRVQLLKEKKMLAAGFSGAAGEPVRRGTLAVALAQALSIKGGLSMRLFGPQPRYATRELQYAGIYPPSSPQQTFSGAEFLGIIGRAEDYERLRSEGFMAVEAPPMAAPAAAPAGAQPAAGGE